jgi:two-component system sensor histidine kinase TctE
MLLLLLAGAINAYLIALRTVNESYDRLLLDEATDIAEQVQKKHGAFAVEMSPAIIKILLNDEYDHIYYQVLGPHREFIAGVRDLPTGPQQYAVGSTYYDAIFHGEKIHGVALTTHIADANLQIVVAETTVRRDALFRDIWLSILVPELVLMFLTGIVLWFGLRYGLAPLTRLSQELSQRSHLDLRKVDDIHVPEEAQPLVREINQLLQRLEGSMQSQRTFISNAAHQIRTPIAALQMQVELALQQGDGANLLKILKQILVGVQRTAHLSNQLLSLARAEPGSMAVHEFAPVDLHVIIETVAQTFVSRAIEKDIDLGFELEHLKINGSSLLLQELVGNLVDNAIRYTPIGGRVTVRLCRSGNSIVLEVEDNGPGIAKDEQDKIFKRFYRSIGSPEGGSGLGLAIVQEITNLHLAKITINLPAMGSGAVFSVQFLGNAVALNRN